MTSTGDDDIINQEEKGDFSLDEICDTVVEQIALYVERAEKVDSFFVDERLRANTETGKTDRKDQGCHLEGTTTKKAI